MWVMGECCGRLNNVWSSSDGSSWILATAAASWSARGSLRKVVYNDKMWVTGGFDGTFLNDV
jgi:hypothetical protein